MIPRSRTVSDDDIVLLDFEVHGGPIQAITRAALEAYRDEYVIEDITTIDDASRGWDRYLARLRSRKVYKNVTLCE